MHKTSWGGESMNGFRLQRLGQMLEPEPGNPLRPKAS
jgi:hypothetical protein